MSYCRAAGSNRIPEKLFLFAAAFLCAAGSNIYSQSVPWTRIDGPYSGDAYVVATDHRANIFLATQSGYVYRSTDSGKNWSHADSGLAIQSTSYLLVDSSDNLYAGDEFSGLFRSTNHGAGWSKSSLAGAASSAAFFTGGRLAVGGISTVSISSDGGTTWSTSQLTSERLKVLSLAEDSLGNLYAGLQAIVPGRDPPYGGGVYMSSDGGKNWSLLGLELNSISSMVVNSTGKVFVSAGYGVYIGSQADTSWIENNNGIGRANIWSLSITPGGKIAATSDYGVFVYDDATAYWNRVGVGLSAVQVRSIGYLGDGTMFVGTSRDGVFRLDASGNWAQIGFRQAAVVTVDVDSAAGLLACTTDMIFRMNPQGGEWLCAGEGFTGGKVNEILRDKVSQRAYAASPGGLFYSTDGGSRWRSSLESNVYSIAIGGGGTLYAGTSAGLLISRNGGIEWAKPSCIALPTSPVRSVAVDSSHVLYAGIRNNGVFRSTDGGNFWLQTGLTSLMMFNTVNSLRVDRSGKIFAGTDTAGAFYSTDGGTNWYRLEPLDASNVSEILVDSSDDCFIATLDKGVFVSHDGGMDWKSMSDGLTDTYVTSIAKGNDGTVYAATGSGIFMKEKDVSDVVEREHVPQAFELYQNYPNPFNPTTAISYRLSAVSVASLIVFDVLGRKVETLVSGVEKPGSHEVWFDGSGLPSGVYFYSLKADGKVLTKKMVLVK